VNLREESMTSEQPGINFLEVMKLAHERFLDG